MSERKKELLEAILQYLLKHGVAGASLRPMAAALGTSARILMFHFKSKEELLQDVMQELNDHLQRSFEKLAPTGSRRKKAPLQIFWQWATRKENFPYLRLLYEVQIIAAQNPARYGRYLKKASIGWQNLVLKSLSASVRSRSMATLCIAVFDGLSLELMISGDHRRLQRALDEFISVASRDGTALPPKSGQTSEGSARKIPPER